MRVKWKIFLVGPLSEHLSIRNIVLILSFKTQLLYYLAFEPIQVTDFSTLFIMLEDRVYFSVLTSPTASQLQIHCFVRSSVMLGLGLSKSHFFFACCSF